MSEFVMPLKPSGGWALAVTLRFEVASAASHMPALRPTRGSAPEAFVAPAIVGAGRGVAAAGAGAGAGVGACAVWVDLPHAAAASKTKTNFVRDVMFTSARVRSA